MSHNVCVLCVAEYSSVYTLFENMSYNVLPYLMSQSEYSGILARSAHRNEREDIGEASRM